MGKIGLIIAYFFVAGVAVSILVILFRLIRSFFRYHKRMDNEKQEIEKQETQAEEVQDET
jgi:uncharacterized protein YoxC